jgi:hypothetical protein
MAGNRGWGTLWIEDLSGIENSLGIKNSFEFAYDSDIDFANRAWQEAFLG